MRSSVLAAFAVLAMAGVLDQMQWRRARSRFRQRLASDRASGSRPEPQLRWTPRLPAPARKLLVDAGYGGDAERLWRWWLVALPGTLLVGAAVLPPVSMPAVLLAATLGPFVALWSQRGRRVRLVEGALPDALEAVGRSLRSGSSLRQAIDEASDRIAEPLAGDLRSIVGRVEHGVPIASALGGWAEARSPSSSVRLACSALTMAADLGGSGARAVDRIARSLRERRGVQRELHALSSQARLSALVIVLAPAAFGLAGLAVDGTTATFLLSTPPGWACLAGGALFDAVGALWMTRVVRGVAT